MEILDTAGQVRLIAPFFISFTWGNETKSKKAQLFATIFHSSLMHFTWLCCVLEVQRKRATACVNMWCHPSIVYHHLFYLLYAALLGGGGSEAVDLERGVIRALRDLSSPLLISAWAISLATMSHEMMMRCIVGYGTSTAGCSTRLWQWRLISRASSSLESVCVSKILVYSNSKWGGSFHLYVLSHHMTPPSSIKIIIRHVTVRYYKQLISVTFCLQF